ncbi:SH3 domain-containing protein, partial [Anaerolineales bacterium HSG25]|nr:SH3 domain-containing protein [Anaerolineales bacterium HSG25]
QQNMNVRSGPGTNYLPVGSASAGDSSAIIGRNDDNSWVQVEYPSEDGKGWVYAQLIDIQGDISTLPIGIPSMDPIPPAPPPEPEPEQSAPPPEPKYQFTPAPGWHASENAGIVHFKGRIYDPGGNLVNGYSILIDNWAWKVISHPSGGSHWYPGNRIGEWDIVFPKEQMAQAQGLWYMSVVIYQCDFIAGFDAQCKNYTQLSREHKIEVVSPDESIINADWTCNWDCDKGVYRSWSKDRGYE